MVNALRFAGSGKCYNLVRGLVGPAMLPFCVKVSPVTLAVILVTAACSVTNSGGKYRLLVRRHRRAAPQPRGSILAWVVFGWLATLR